MLKDERVGMREIIALKMCAQVEAVIDCWKRSGSVVCIRAYYGGMLVVLKLLAAPLTSVTIMNNVMIICIVKLSSKILIATSADKSRW